MTNASQVWTPEGESRAHVRNARITILGSLSIVLLTAVVLALRLLEGGLTPGSREVVALLAALVLVVVHLFSGNLRFLGVVPRSGWLSAFGGISVAYVFVHLLPELAEGQETLEETGAGALLGYLEHHVYLIALLGLAVFYYVEKRSLDSRRERRESTGEDQTGSAAFRLSIASFAAYNVLIGYLLLHGEFEELEALALYTLALGVHFVVNDFGLREHHKEGYQHVGRYVISVAVLAGWLLGMVAEIPEAAIAVIIAFIGGGVVLNVLKEELPGERRARFLPFAGGAAGYAALLQLI